MLIVTAPAASLDLTTSQRVLDVWDNKKEPTADVVAMAVTSASRTIAHWCRREFVEQEYEEILEAPERFRLVTQESPVTAVASVDNDGEAITDYRIIEEVGILFKTDQVPWTGPTPIGGILGASVLASDRYPSLNVKYTAGYITRTLNPAAITLPLDIEDQAIYLATQLIRSSLGEPVGEPTEIGTGRFKTVFPHVDSMTGSGSGYWAESLGDPSLTWMPMRVRRALLPYRRFMG